MKIKSKQPKRPKILVILGPTASGKSALAVKLAKRFKGEVISADSRQVYKGLDIGTGKITGREMRGIPHHLLNVADPKRQFTAAQYARLAKRAIRDILRRGKLPIICGGTGLYINAALYDNWIPEVSPNMALRKKLERLSSPELFTMLKKLDPRRAKNIDRHNPRRLTRAIEIARTLGKVPPLNEKTGPYKVLKLGISIPEKELRNRINKRLALRVRQGMLAEVKNLKKRGLASKRLESLGLEYRYLNRYLENKISKTELVQKLQTEIWRYAKRQMTWFKKDKEIVWLKNGTIPFIKIMRSLGSV